MMMQYYPVALRAQALRDILSGPEHMWRNLATAMPAARALQKDFPETQVHHDREGALSSRHGRQVFPKAKRNQFDSPTGLRLRLFTATTLLAHWLHKPQPENVAVPEVEFGKSDAYWWRLPRYDSVLVSSADGAGKSIYTRDRKKFRAMLRDSVRLHRRLQREWPKLSQQYRAAVGELTSEGAWREHLELDA